MDIKLTPKPASEVQSNEGFQNMDVLREEVTTVDEEFTSIDLPKSVGDDLKDKPADNKPTELKTSEVDENDSNDYSVMETTDSDDKLKLKLGNKADVKVTSEKDLELKEIEQKDVGIKVDPIREEEGMVKMAELKKETHEEKLNPPVSRHTFEEKKPEVKIQNRTEFDKSSLNQIGDILEKKTKFLSTNLAEVNEKLKKDDIDREKETDFLRTNVYYSKKMYEEIVELKKIIRTQGYMRYGMTFLFLILTVLSMYYGMQFYKDLLGGGFSNLFSSVSNMFGGNGGMQANLFNNALQSSGSTQIDLTGLDGTSGAISSGIDVQQIVDQFLKK